MRPGSFPLSPLPQRQSEPSAATSSAAVASPAADEILLVESDAAMAQHGAVLRGTYRIANTASADVAIQYAAKNSPTLIVIDTDAVGDAATVICRAAKNASRPATTLVTTSKPEIVPALLVAGC